MKVTADDPVVLLRNRRRENPPTSDNVSKKSWVQHNYILLVVVIYRKEYPSCPHPPGKCVIPKDHPKMLMILEPRFCAACPPLVYNQQTKVYHRVELHEKGAAKTKQKTQRTNEAATVRAPCWQKITKNNN